MHSSVFLAPLASQRCETPKCEQAAENRCHLFATWAESAPTPFPSFAILFLKPPISPLSFALPAFLPPSSLGGHFLPVSTSLRMRRGLYPSLFKPPSFLSAFLPGCVSFQLHYLPPSPSSRMTCSDSTQACRFEVTAVGEQLKKKTTQ